MLSFFKHSRVFRNHPIFLQFGVSLPPSHLLDHSTAGLSWNNDFLVRILWGISFQTWLLWVYVALPGNESIFPKNQPGTFWDGEILVPFGVIRDRLLEKLIFGEKAGRESWRNHSRILRHFAMKSIMLQELNENSLATRILDSSLWSPATQITESPMFVNEKNRVKTHQLHLPRKRTPQGVAVSFVVKFSQRLVVKYLLEHLRLTWSSAWHCSPERKNPGGFREGKTYCWCFGNPTVEVDSFSQYFLGFHASQVG